MWHAALAQLVEHIIRNDGVTGSNPVSGTTFLARKIRDILVNRAFGWEPDWALFGRLGWRVTRSRTIPL
jgi:hypothetical protein